jgi:predicted ATP-grasp superfamily ATP-dependent carboligase
MKSTPSEKAGKVGRRKGQKSEFSKRKRVLVLDGDTRTCLAIVRSLGRAAWAVSVAGSRTDALAFSSCFANEILLVPAPINNPDAFAKMILERASAGDLAAIVPCTDVSIAALGPYMSELRKLAVLPCGSEKVLHLLADRAEYLDVAAKIGLQTPKQVAIHDVAELPKLPFSFPVFLKPKHSMVRVGIGYVKIEVMKALNLDELSFLIRSLPRDALPGLVQSRLRGEVERYYAVYRKGEPVAEFGQKRIRWLNIIGNPSVLRQATELDPQITDLSRRFLAEIEMDGPVMMEFMRDVPGGAPVLLKVSGHFWKSLQTAMEAGVDIPCLAVDNALGRQVKTVTSPRYGIRSRWLVGDALHLINYLLDGKDRFYAANESPGSLEAISNFLRANRDASTHVEDKPFDDPRPYYLMRNRYFREWLKKLRQNFLSRFRMGPSVYRGIIFVEENATDKLSVSVGVMRETLEKRGFRFVFMAVPAATMTPQAAVKFVDLCDRECTEQFLVIPGLEYSFSDLHILALGIREALEVSSAIDLIRQVRKKGGMAIWSRVRPGDIPNYPDLVDELNGVMIWNVNKHGPYGPDPILLDEYAAATERSPYLGAFMSMDPFSAGGSRRASIRVYAGNFNETGIISAMENGLFRLSGIFFSARADRLNFFVYRAFAQFVDVVVHWFRGVFDQIFYKGKKFSS